jgi:CheY-like chemotaxis protein
VSEAVHALIVDDDPTESSALADLLRASGTKLKVKTIQPPTTVEEAAKAILEALPDEQARVLLLDYRLEDNAFEGQAVRYRGGTVAGYLRDEDPELPIALLTSEQKLHDWVESRPGMKNVFDWTLVKSEISAPEGAARGYTEIVDFAHAWQRARGWPEDPAETWTRLADLMRAPQDGMLLFRELEAEPPRGDVTGDVIHWLLHRALDIPGPLLGAGPIRVTLGLSREAFSTEQVEAWLEDARYTGALGAFGERWWAYLARAKLAEACGGFRPLDASARAAGLGQALETTLSYEGCDWCGGERTLDACFVCSAATDAAHCLRPLTAPLPAWADPGVVCFRCIATGRADEHGLRFPPQAEDIVDGLKEDRIRPPDT